MKQQLADGEIILLALVQVIAEASQYDVETANAIVRVLSRCGRDAGLARAPLRQLVATLVRVSTPAIRQKLCDAVAAIVDGFSDVENVASALDVVKVSALASSWFLAMIYTPQSCRYARAAVFHRSTRWHGQASNATSA